MEDHLRQQRTLLEAKRPLLGRRQFPEVDAFLAAFDEPQWRRPILAIIGGRGMGKSQLAAKILTELAAKLQVPRYLEITVECDEHRTGVSGQDRTEQHRTGQAGHVRTE